ncbi:solute carrier family 22 member 7-like isoform X2 [Homarus americanus]|uniref:solute carrier family 22 member 7-like isoform X1 n=1 Tax=Homarus americanus TaxID=6706 RepID=UPI001C4392B7|nr:solute carrier family 22 member 7-like isoform X1 [Homarus americanus]XP_042237120.1 solute carrier family 22 member 7-like isoform X2 [Homarus americanus]
MNTPVFEQLLEEVGDSGRHQLVLFWLFVVPINFIIPWVALLPIFMTSTPEHWCHVPGRPPNVSIDQWKQLTIPREHKEGIGETFSSCRQYNLTSGVREALGQSSEVTQLTSSTFNASYRVVGCQTGWDYDHTYYDMTLSMELNWVCDRSSQVVVWMSVGLAGNVIGTLVLNSLSDLVGRLPMLLVSAMLYAVFGLVRLYVKDYLWIMVTMFLASTSFPSILELSLIITLEQVSPGWRARITSTSFIMWTAGMCLLPLLAWLTRDWVLLGVITTVPFFLLILCWWFLPESPRWMLSRNNIDKCAELMKRIARRNRKEVPEKLDETLQSIAKTHNSEKNYGALQLFQNSTVLFRTFLLTVCYSCYNLFYYGLTYNISNLSGNEFINFFLLAITELPSNLLGWWMSDFLGRRWTTAGCSLLAAITALINVFLINGAQWVPILVLIISKMFVTISFMVVYVQCAEIYPTTHRSCGTGLSSLVSSIFGTTAPYIAYSDTYGSWMPYLILSAIGIIGFIFASLIPETLNTDLPQSLLDASNFLTTEKYWSYKGKRLTSGKAGITQQTSPSQGHVNLAIAETNIANKTAAS